MEEGRKRSIVRIAWEACATYPAEKKVAALCGSAQRFQNLLEFTAAPGKKKSNSAVQQFLVLRAVGGTVPRPLRLPRRRRESGKRWTTSWESGRREPGGWGKSDCVSALLVFSETPCFTKHGSLSSMNSTGSKTVKLGTRAAICRTCSKMASVLERGTERSVRVVCRPRRTHRRWAVRRYFRCPAICSANRQLSS